MHTAVLSVVHVNVDFFKDAKERLFPFSVRLTSSKCGLSCTLPTGRNFFQARFGVKLLNVG